MMVHRPNFHERAVAAKLADRYVSQLGTKPQPPTRAEVKAEAAKRPFDRQNALEFLREAADAVRADDQRRALDLIAIVRRLVFEAPRNEDAK